MTTVIETPATTSKAALQRVLTERERPPRPSVLSSVGTFAWRAMISFRHAPEQLLDVLFMPIIGLIMFNFLFGGAIAGSTGDYLQFLLPGILVQNIILMSVYTGASLNHDVTKGIFDRFRTLPIWQPSALVGALAGDVTRFVITMAILVGFGMVLGFRAGAGLTGILLAGLVLLLFAFSVGWIFTAVALVVRTPESVSGTSMMVLFPMTFISNIFAPPATMPGWMRAIVEVNPVSHAATAVRGLVHGTATAGQIGLVLLWCAVLTVVFGSLTAFLYRRKQ
ncbi:ABC transporter permease [Amycolatopsis suaedae]|uniref:Transport permease protein n=1 Tax=Amycolatopsis suaedae TaxID=2510978 RepID=A0A4Q7JBY2_9PSEU|nr:ABC transporter permease [Amycolatopsis suaedae]RZQ65360.1 ABC transporter permease [Amycolatopsis suaedae]